MGKKTLIYVYEIIDTPTYLFHKISFVSAQRSLRQVKYERSLYYTNRDACCSEFPCLYTNKMDLPKHKIEKALEREVCKLVVVNEKIYFSNKIAVFFIEKKSLTIIIAGQVTINKWKI